MMLVLFGTRSGEVPPHGRSARPLHAAPAAMVKHLGKDQVRALSIGDQLSLGRYNENWVRFVKSELFKGNEGAKTAVT